MIAELLVAAILGLTVHEAAHAYAADRFGDPIPRALGRVTFDPLAHLELVGSVVLPVAVGLLSGGMVLVGWGKSVPLSPFWLGRKRMVLVLLAGPAAQLALAVPFAAMGLWVASWGCVTLAVFSLGIGAWRFLRRGVPRETSS